MDEVNEVVFEPIEITEADLIVISDADYREMLEVGEKALNEFMKDLEG